MRRSRLFYKQGFTLFELSIVLVIIGLLVGSILVGQDLYTAARNRSIIKELNQYQQAVLSFSQKYSALPGDMKSPSTFWPNQTWSGNGNGNGIIVWGYEGPEAWLQLQLSGLIPTQNINVNTVNPLAVCNGASGHPHCVSGQGCQCRATPGINIPLSSTLKNAGWTIGVNRNTGVNVLMFGGYYASTSKNGFTHIRQLATLPVLSSKDMWSIDTKVDDGLPTNGTVRVRNICSYPTCYSGTAYTISDSVSCSFDAAIGQ